MAGRRRLQVVKVGGSLLDDPELPRRLRAWLSLQSRASTALVVGGGRFADAVRYYDKMLRLGDLAAHELAIRAMSLATALLARQLPEAPVTEDLDHARKCPLCLIAPSVFLNGEAGQSLPASWTVTSDSLAAWLARTLEAEELVLLKSVSPPEACSKRQAAEMGLVDRYFPTVAADLPRVRVVHLREEAFAEGELR
jgi:aspartokinase-like uncharacterized kinase